MPPQFNLAFGAGLDKDATPPFLMVPHLRVRTMLLHYSNGEMVRSDNKNVVTIEEKDKNTWASFLTRPTGKPTPNHLIPSSLPARTFEITGANLGPPANIEVADPKSGTFIKRLEVSVKPQKTLEITFHFVEDIGGNKTTRNTGFVNFLISALDSIYESSTNIVFHNRSAAPLQPNVFLPAFVRERKDADEVRSRSLGEWYKLVDKSDRGAFFNVFFIPRVKPRKSNDFFPILETMDANCVCDDDMSVDAVVSVLSHDIGVSLGCSTTSDPKHKNHLMYESPVDRLNLRRRGDFIPKECVNIMNPFP